MYQFRLTVLYFLIIVLTGAIVWKLIDNRQAEYQMTELEPVLGAEARSYELLTSHRIQKLKEFSRVVLETDLPVYMEALMDMKSTVKAMGRETRERFARDTKATVDDKLRYVKAKSQPALNRFKETIASNISTMVDVEGGVETMMADILASGMVGKYDWWPYSYFKVTYIALVEFVYPDLLRRWNRKDLPDLFVLIEPENETARYFVENLAAVIESRPMGQELDRDLLAYDTHITTNFSQVAPVLKDVKAGSDVLMSSGILIRDNRAFVVVATRLEDGDKDFLGTLLVGYELDKTLAERDTARILGMRPVLKSCLDKLEGEQELAASGERCQYELRHQSRGITLVARDRIGKTLILGTSLAEESQSAISDIIKTGNQDGIVVTGDFIAMGVALPVESQDATGQALAYVTLNLDQALMPFTNAKTVLIVVALLLFGIAFIILQFLTRRLRKPFEAIDQGIHEIIGGNFEYRFPFGFAEELPNSMAQSLSVMKAVLLCEPLPEEEETDNSWREELEVEAQAMEESRGGGLAGIESISQAEITETKTEYYRRLFGEYVEARKSLGLDVAAVTYVRFIEKIARNEKALRDRFGCKQVLFRVELKENQVALIPLKVREGCED